MIRRGQVHLVDLEPVRGSEADKRRPAVILSRDAANRAAEVRGRGVVTVVPVTSSVRRVLPFQVLLASARVGLEVDGKAQAEQVRSVDVVRVGDQVGALPPDLLAEVEDALRLHLDL